MSDPMTVNPARPDDLDSIMVLERSGFALAEQWSERSWQNELLADQRRVLIARAHRPLGVISVRLGREAELMRVVVSGADRRRGVGSALVRAGVGAAAAAGGRAMILEVRWDNEPAIALYQQLGFEQLAARSNYYGPGVDALILKLWDLAESNSDVPT